MNTPLAISAIQPGGARATFGTAWLADRSVGVELAGYGYIEEEFVVVGAASVWRYDDQLQPVRSVTDEPFTTRVLVRRPADPAKFSGLAQVEALHPDLDSAFIWGAIHPWLMRSGHAWVGVTAFTSAVKLLQDYSSERYGAISIPLEGMQYDIVGAVAQALCAGAFDGLVPSRMLLAGWSATGSFTRVFVQDGFHDRWRRPDGGPVFDGYLVCISSAGAGLSGYPPLSPDSAPLPLDHPRRTMGPHDVPVFELLSEMESETNELSTRDDSDEPSDRYRLYQLAGTAHIEKGREALANRTQYEGSGGRSFRLSVVEERTDGRLDIMARAAFESLARWVADGIPAPHAARFRFADAAIGYPAGRFDREGMPRVEGRALERDADGNVVGGIRTPWIVVPTGSYSPHSTPTADADRPPEWMPFSRPEMIALLMGSRVPFAAEEVIRRYGDYAHYRELFAKAAAELVAANLLLEPDAVELLETTTERWNEAVGERPANT